MTLTEQYRNLLQNYRKEMIKNATLEKMYNDKCVASTLEIQDLNEKLKTMYATFPQELDQK